MESATEPATATDQIQGEHRDPSGARHDREQTTDACDPEHADQVVQELLCLPEVADLLQTIKDDAKKDKVVSAARIIAGQDISPEKKRAALQEAADAIEAGQIRVFFSYKMKDGKGSEKDAAQKIVTRLSKLGANSLKIEYAENFKASENKNEAIKAAIDRAHWFIILIPEKDQNRDWLFFEAGRFWKKITADKVNRIFCLHSGKTKIPDPIDQYISIAPKVDDLKRFLETVFFEPDTMPGFGAVNPNISDLDKEAGRFTQYLEDRSKPLVKKYYTPYLKLLVKDAGNIESAAELDDADILKANSSLLRIFGWQEIPRSKKLGELIESVSCLDSKCAWKDALLDRIKTAFRGRKIEPIHATFEGAEKGKFYHPILISTDREDEGPPEIFNVSFDLQLGTQIRQLHLPDSIKVLLTALRLAHRFRWEIIDPYKTLGRQGDLQRIQNVLEQVETEAHQNGLMDEEILVDLFAGEEAEALARMFADWKTLRDPETKSGRLDKALEERDIEAVQSVLQEVDHMNRAFISLAHQRLYEEISASEGSNETIITDSQPQD